MRKLLRFKKRRDLNTEKSPVLQDPDRSNGSHLKQRVQAQPMASKSLSDQGWVLSQR